MNEKQISLLATRRHVFLSWHDIQFTVPVSKGGGGQSSNEKRMQDARFSLLRSHSFGKTGGSIMEGVSSNGINSMATPVNDSDYLVNENIERRLSIS